MKRDRDIDKGQSSLSPVSMAPAASSSSSPGKGKKMWGEELDSGGMDELLEVLGYKVRSSDMADVAQKLEQLEMAMGTTMEDGISQLSETTFYNPSDLSGWVQSMLSELNNTSPSSSTFDSVVLPGDSSTTIIDFTNNKEISPRGSRIYDDSSEYDLRAIPGGAIYNETRQNSLKRTKTMPVESHQGRANGLDVTRPGLDSTRPVVLVDSQETGIRLVHTLMACAEAVQQDNMKLADALVNHIAVLAASQAGAMRKVATYLAQALARRIYKGILSNTIDPSYLEILQMHFYESCPYLKFAHLPGGVRGCYNGVREVVVVF